MEDEKAAAPAESVCTLPQLQRELNQLVSEQSAEIKSLADQLLPLLKLRPK